MSTRPPPPRADHRPLLVYEAAVDLRRSDAGRSHVFGLARQLHRTWPGRFTVLVPAFGTAEAADGADGFASCRVVVTSHRVAGFLSYEVEKVRLLWRLRRSPHDVTWLTRFSLLNVSALVARLLGLRVAVEVNGLPHRELRLRGRLAVFAWPAAMSLWLQAGLAHRVIVVSPDIARFLRRAGISAHVVPNGVDPEEFAGCSPKTTSGNLLFVGSLAPWQDLTLVLQALRRLVADGRRRWHLTVVGDGEVLGPLRSLVRSLALEHVVEFTGAQDRAAVRRWLEWASVCLLPRVPNAPPGSPLKLYEYLAANRPTVAADVDALTAVSSPLVFRYAPGDVVSLADAITAADRAASLEAGGIARLRDAMSWESRAAQVVTVLTGAPR